MRLGVDGEELSVVFEHLLVMRDLPLPGRRVPEEAALDVVVHATGGHRAERAMEHRRDLRVAEPTVLVEKEAEKLGLREFRLAPKAAELRVVLAAHERPDLVDDLKAEIARFRRASFVLLLAQLGDALRQLRSLRRPEIGDLREIRPHGIGRYVGAAVNDLPIGCEERRRRPAAHVVAAIHVGPLVVVHADRDVALVDQPDDFGIAVARFIHDVAPVAPHRADREEDRLVRDLRLLKRFLTPRSPADLGGAVRAWRETEAHWGISSSSILLPNGSNTYVRRQPGIGSASSKRAPAARSVATATSRSSTRRAKCRRG